MRTRYRLLCFMLMTALGMPVLNGQTPANNAQLRVTTTPEGATVTCDGILQDKSPVTVGNLAPGVHLIQIEYPGFVKTRRTVEIAARQKAAIDVKLEHETGLVLIQSSPDGAELFVDGGARGKAPLIITDLPMGRYRVKATKMGFLPRESDLIIEKRAPQKLVMALESDSASLNISSTPPGASVTVNGLSVGVTPCVAERLPSGENKVLLTLTDYVPYQDTVKLRAGDSQSVGVTLQPMPASLSVMSTPAGAQVYINDQLRGPTPLVVDSIVPGNYSLRLELDGYDTQTQSVELNKRDSRVVEFTLSKRVGTLEVVCDQGGVAVQVDGESRGTTVQDGGDRTPSTFRLELGVGEHRLELRKKGYVTVEKRITIAQGESVRVRELMKRHFVSDTMIRLKSGEVIEGVGGRKFPDGDIEIETRPGIFRTLKSSEIEKIETVTSAAN